MDVTDRVFNGSFYCQALFEFNKQELYCLPQNFSICVSEPNGKRIHRNAQQSLAGNMRVFDWEGRGVLYVTSVYFKTIKLDLLYVGICVEMH